MTVRQTFLALHENSTREHVSVTDILGLTRQVNMTLLFTYLSYMKLIKAIRNGSDAFSRGFPFPFPPTFSMKINLIDFIECIVKDHAAMLIRSTYQRQYFDVPNIHYQKMTTDDVL